MSEIIAGGIAEASTLRQFAETFASNPTGMKTPLVSEIKLHLDSDGFHATACDSASVAMVGPATLHARAFEHYDAPGQAVVGIDLTKLLDRIKPADSGDLVEFELDMETRKLHLSYGSADVSMTLIDSASVRTEPDIPDLDLPNTVTLEGHALDHAVTIPEMVSDHVTIRADPEAREVAFIGKGDTDDATVSYGDEDLLDAGVSMKTESVFSLDYLRAVVKPIPDDAEVTLRFGDEFPIRFEWEATDGAFEVEQTLAPRIQST